MLKTQNTLKIIIIKETRLKNGFCKKYLEASRASTRTQNQDLFIYLFIFILVFGSKNFFYLLNSLFPFFNPSISFYRQCCDSGKLSKYMKYEFVTGVAFFVTTTLAIALGFSSVDLILEVGFFFFFFWWWALISMRWWLLWVSLFL